MPGRIFPLSLTQVILDSSRELRLLSHIHCPSLPGFEPPTTPQLHLHLPEAWSPAQYLVDMGLQPTLARRLSSTYMDFVDRYRTTCQSHFYRATRGGHLTEYYREVFTVLFRRTTQAWSSQMVSIIRVQLCQVVTPQVIVRPEYVDASTIVISKALGILNSLSHRYAWTTQRKPYSLRDSDLKQLIFLLIEYVSAPLFLSTNLIKLCQMAASPSIDLASRLEEVSEQTHAPSTKTFNSHLVCSRSVFRT